MLTHSVNTNTSSMMALSLLRETDARMNITQQRISSGLRVNTAKDDPANWSIATRMNSQNIGWEATKNGLGLASAALGVANAAGEGIVGLLDEIRAKAIQAQGGGLDTESRKALNKDITSMMDQIDTMAKSAEFNGINLLQRKNGHYFHHGKDDSFGALASPDGHKININAHDMSLQGLGLKNRADVLTERGAARLLDQVDHASAKVREGLQDFGSKSKRIEIQNTYINDITDAISQGIGNMVDADMASEAARLKALEAKQQLGIQSLSMANTRPMALLALFGN